MYRLLLVNEQCSNNNPCDDDPSHNDFFMFRLKGVVDLGFLVTSYGVVDEKGISSTLDGELFTLFVNATALLLIASMVQAFSLQIPCADPASIPT